MNKLGFILLLVWIATGVVAFVIAPRAEFAKQPRWMITGIDQTAWRLTVRDARADAASPKEKQSSEVTFSIPTELRPNLLSLRAGDYVTLAPESLQAGQALNSISVLTLRPTMWHLWMVAIFGALTVPVFAAILLGGDGHRFIIGADKRYSNSKFQAAVWFTVLIGAYVATFGLRWSICGSEFIGAIQIPTNLLLLSGLSALTFAGAKWITTSNIKKVGEEAAKELRESGLPADALDIMDTRERMEKAFKRQADRPRFFYDLTHDDDEKPDLGDFQMLVVTALAVVVFVLTIWRFLSDLPLSHTLSLPDVDSTILAAFGLGQGAYLMKKVAV